MKSISQLDQMYRHACEQIQPKPDPAKGKTSREWAAEMGESWSNTRLKIRKLVEAGVMLEAKDWRPFNGGMRKEPVYRLNPAKMKGGRK